MPSFTDWIWFVLWIFLNFPYFTNTFLNRRSYKRIEPRTIVINKKRINELYQRIVFFENGIISWINGGIDAPCYDESPYQIYCVDGQISFAKGSRFFQDYLNYITDKIDLEEIKKLWIKYKFL